MRFFARPLVARLTLLTLVAALLSGTPTPAGASWSAPVGLRVDHVEAGAVTLTWAPVPEAPGYLVTYAPTNDRPRSRQVGTDDAVARVDQLVAGTGYSFTVRVVDADGATLSPDSAALVVRLPASGAPAGDPPAATATSLKAPTALKVSSRSRSGLALSWNTVRGAEAYRVKYASSSSWKGAKYAFVREPWVELTKLSPSRLYYVRVRTVTGADRAVSGYSGTVTSRTRSSRSYPYLRPRSVTTGLLTATGATLVWPSRGTGLSYRVRYDTDARYRSPRSIVVRTAKAALAGLDPNTRYNVSVRVIGASNGPSLSEYSATQPVQTPTALAPLRVASYNVKAHNSFHGLPNEQPWLQRRDGVASLIRRQAPDVIGLQEAQQSRIRLADGKLSKVAQMEDLVARLGSPYKLVNPYRYNCVKSTTLTRCVSRDREASRGIRIVYNSSELTLKTYGARRLSYVSPDDMERYVSWATFRHKDSGKSFMFVDVHFENIDDLIPGSTLYYENRKKQTRESLAEAKAHNPDGLPVIFVGDLNATKTSVPDNAPYDIMRSAGFVDPLGNTYRSTTVAPWATVETRIRTEYNSYNRWQVSPPKSSHPNGSYFDYIFTSGSMRVSEWETAMTLNSDGTYQGVIPSDHHLIRATVWLP